MKAHKPAVFRQIPDKQPATPLLAGVQTPADLRSMRLPQLLALADEMRGFLLYSLSQTGGHLGAGLGVVELTLALHRVFKTPFDKLIWDVGHQSYPHKMLTGRWKAMQSLRQKGGLAPFTDPAESEYDTFVAGHAANSISAALGFALSRDRLAGDEQVVAVTGDGALTAGLASEALSHAGALGTQVTLVLNDNGMSISPNVGGLAEYLKRLGTGAAAPHLFTSLGIGYTGPVDGHDLPELMRQLESVRKRPGPQLLHVLTRKGKGYLPAESSPTLAHSLTKIAPAGAAKKPGIGFSSLFGSWLVKTAARDARLMAITPAMGEGSGMTQFAEKFPDRFIDAAIAEQHAASLAAGLAAAGQKPVLAIYSTFLQRAYDQVVHDIALQNLDVTLAIDRAGLLEDGPTHSGVFDTAFLRCLPNLMIAAPSSAEEMESLLQTAYEFPGPAAVRYPRGEARPDPAAPDKRAKGKALAVGKARALRLAPNAESALLSFGTALHWLTDIAEETNAELFDMRFIKPLDTGLLDHLCKRHQLLVSVEEHALMGGAGSAVAEYLAGGAKKPRLVRLGIRDAFIPHGRTDEMLEDAGLDAAGLRRQILAAVQDSG